MSKKIFILEDDQNIQELLKYNLEKNGYWVELFQNPNKLLESIHLSEADLLLLDIMLPGELDGYQVCRKLKENKATKDIPIIFLTAKSEEFDAVLGLELGAEDYIKKPFGINELLARIKVVIRRSLVEHTSTPSIFSVRDLEIDFEKHIVYKGKKELFLPFKEFELLKILMENKGRVLTRDLLLEKVWGFEYSGETRTVDVHIRYLRQKIEDDDRNPKHILTVRGIGYKFNEKLELK